MEDGSDNDFYIGYLEKAPRRNVRFSRNVLLLLLVGMAILALIIVKFQIGFSSSTYELGSLTEVDGVLTINPVPMLTLDDKESVLLIGYGKFGAGGAIREAIGEYFDGGRSYRVKLSGSLVYHDGRSLMELTKGAMSVLEWKEMETASHLTGATDTITLRGEIIDPKCYFGVMKPGEGKPHRSCAIRCISGGIPPVLKVSSTSGHNSYFILRGENGRAINELVLDYVAEPVEIQGSILKFSNWMILYIDESIGIRRLL